MGGTEDAPPVPARLGSQGTADTAVCLTLLFSGELLSFPLMLPYSIYLLNKYMSTWSIF